MPHQEPLKRRHHTVPRFHLERFADERGQLMRVALPGEKRHRVSVGNAAVEKDFYLVEQDDGTRSDALENHLARIEAAAASAVHAVVDEHVWPVPHWVRKGISGWAASQALRTTTQRQSHGEIADMLLKLTIGVGGKPQLRSVLRGESGREPTQDEVDRLWETLSDFDSYAVAPHRNSSLQVMLEMLPGTAAMFYDRAWTVVDFQRKALITCDNPVYLVPAPDHPRQMGIGVGTAAQILIPLARRVALVLGDIDGKEARGPGTAAMARTFNQALAWNARQAIFHHPGDDPLAGIELPQPGRRVTRGYEQIRSMVFPEGMAARMRPAGSGG